MNKSLYFIQERLIDLDLRERENKKIKIGYLQSFVEIFVAAIKNNNKKINFYFHFMILSCS